MIKIKAPEAEVGAIVARFQTDELTDGHKNLLDFVLKNHEKVLIFLGLSPLLTTANDPLDYQARRQMIREHYPESEYPNLEILYIKDINNDDVWSKHLDDQINSVAQNQSVLLYGSRDSFIPYYKGRFQTVELEASLNISATEIRRRIKSKTRPNKDFRAGAIWAAHNQYPTAYPTIDVAILNEDETEILLGKKPFETKWRFIGGFVEPTSDSLEHNVKMEAQQETGVEVDDIKYIGSMRIDDWRYRKQRDKIITSFFKAKYIFGHVQPDDDIEVAQWHRISDLKPEDFVGSHNKLFEMLLKNLNK